MSDLDHPRDVPTAGSGVTSLDEPAGDEVRNELRRIAASGPFRDSLQLTSFLTFVVEAVLAGRSDRIKSYTIAVDALHRDPSFDPQSDPIFRVEAGRLRRALAHYYATDGLNDPIVIDLPRGNYVPSFRTRKLPVGLRKLPFSGRRVLYRAARQRMRLFALVASVALVVSLVPALALLMWQQANGIVTSRTDTAEQRNGVTVPALYVDPVRVSGTPSPNSISSTMFRELLNGALARFDDVNVLVEAPAAEKPAKAPRPGPSYRIVPAIF